jgi:preprotein translocase subunit YajC
VFNIVHAQEVAQSAADGGAGGDVSPPFNPMLMIVIMCVAMGYFMLFGPERKRSKERKAMLESLAKNDRVVTQGGICGTVIGLSDRTVVLRVSDDDNIKMEFVRGAIAQVEPRDADKS